MSGNSINSLRFVNKRVDKKKNTFLSNNLLPILELLNESVLKRKVLSKSKEEKAGGKLKELDHELEILNRALLSLLNNDSPAVITLVPCLGELLTLVKEVQSNNINFPLHSQYIQPWNKKQTEVRHALGTIRKKLSGKGENSLALLEVLKLFAKSSNKEAEIFRQIGLALMTDSRFPKTKHLASFEDFKSIGWGEEKIIFSLLNETTRKWGFFVQVSKSQRRKKIEEIFTLLKVIYSIKPTTSNTAFVDSIIKKKDYDLYMVFKRLIRHSNNRETIFSLSELETNFVGIKQVRRDMKRAYRNEFETDRILQNTKEETINKARRAA
jgi:hypothetical protein